MILEVNLSYFLFVLCFNLVFDTEQVNNIHVDKKRCLIHSTSTQKQDMPFPISRDTKSWFRIIFDYHQVC